MTWISFTWIKGMIDKNTPALAVERQEIILNLLRENGIVRNTELRDMLGVSIVTVRADIKDLEAKGLCRVIWGGAVTEQYEAARAEYNLDDSGQINRDLKRRIGIRAAKMIEAGQTIVIDAGTTTVELVNHLPPDLSGLRLITNALNVAYSAHRLPYIDLFVTGGSLKRPTYSLTGYQAIKAIEAVNCDYAFLGAEGLSAEHGLTSSYTPDVEVKQVMIQSASIVVILADSSKIGRVMPLKVAPLRKIDIVITDRNLPDAARESLQGAQVEVVLV